METSPPTVNSPRLPTEIATFRVKAAIGDLSSEQFDVFVIGGGSAGLALSKEAVDLGLRVGVADYVSPTPKGTSWGLGGTCTNVGCIPKKLMHYSSLCGAAIAEEKETGWELPEKMQHDWARMQANVARHIHSLNEGYNSQLKSRNITYFNAMASFVDSRTLLVSSSYEH